jgi:hypothetical protein
MTRHQRVIIDLAVQVLEAAMIRSDQGKVDTNEVRLALRCLLPHCPERWPLTSFWEAATGPVNFSRRASCTAAFNGIVRQLREAGRYPD